MALALAVVSGFTQAAQAEVRLPKVFRQPHGPAAGEATGDLGLGGAQRDRHGHTGTASQEGQANERGEWKATLFSMKAGGPYTLTVSGSSTVEFDDVMIGEVWLCSGQSNMEMGIGMAQDAAKGDRRGRLPGIRLLMVTKSWTPVPQNDIEGTWKVCSPKTVAEGGWGGFSACAYYFGRELHKKLGVAVGLIDSSWGGTRIESWTPPEGFAAVPALKTGIRAGATG